MNQAVNQHTISKKERENMIERLSVPVAICPICRNQKHHFVKEDEQYAVICSRCQSTSGYADTPFNAVKMWNEWVSEQVPIINRSLTDAIALSLE